MGQNVKCKHSKMEVAKMLCIQNASGHIKEHSVRLSMLKSFRYCVERAFWERCDFFHFFFKSPAAELQKMLRNVAFNFVAR